MTSRDRNGNQGLRPRVGVVLLAGLAVAVGGAVAIQTLTVGAAESVDGESTFVPMSPCRLTDTRPAWSIGPHPTLGPDATATIQATGTNGECAIPDDATGLSMNVTAVNASLPTHLTIWPDGPRPNASSINPVPGQAAFNAVTTLLSDAGSFRVYNLQGAIDVIIDINGFYTETTLTELVDRITDLERVQPVLLRANGDDLEPITSSPRIMATIQLPIEPTGPDDAWSYSAVVNYAITVEQDEAGVQVRCELVDDSTGVTVAQVWESPGSSGSVGHVSGTKLLGGWTDSYDNPSLICSHDGSGDPTIASDIVMTAVFVPGRYLHAS